MLLSARVESAQPPPLGRSVSSFINGFMDESALGGDVSADAAPIAPPPLGGSKASFSDLADL